MTSDCKGVVEWYCIPREVVAERYEALYAEEIDACLEDGPHVRLVKLGRC